MKPFNRFNQTELEFLERFDNDFHKAMKQVMLEIDGPKIDDPKFHELSKRMDKLRKDLSELEDTVNNKGGGY